MSPRVERQAPPYVQITDHYRQQIQDGSLTEGERLPSVAEVAKEWGVAHATAAKAFSQLQVEGLIATSPRGSFVAGKGAQATAPQGRIVRSHRTGSLSAQGEYHQVNVAEVVKAPNYVAELYGVDPGARVVRREWITYENKTAHVLTVTWHLAELADRVPELLSRTPSSVGPLLGQIEQATGPVTRGRDFIHARGADAREATALGIQVGSAITAGTWLAWADDRLIEYGEYCLPPRHTISYPYDVVEGDPADDTR